MIKSLGYEAITYTTLTFIDCFKILVQCYSDSVLRIL